MQKAHRLPPVERVRALLDYNADTGVFRWKPGALVGRNSYLNGQMTGSAVTDSGYRVISIDGKRYRAHRLAWLIMTGCDPVGEIDHRNGIKDDNRWENLRIATASQNLCNRGPQRNSSTGIKGVSWSAERQKYQVTVQFNRKTISVGRFTSIEEAAAASLAARQKLHGEFGRV